MTDWNCARVMPAAFARRPKTTSMVAVSGRYFGWVGGELPKNAYPRLTEIHCLSL
jgi:hypothetical protein